jgi:uracil phosphoribosyltransferase
MIDHLGKGNSIVNQYVAEIREKVVQQDRLRFRRNLERIAEIAGYELSKELTYESSLVKTPLGELEVPQLKDQPVIAAILRAALPMHQGLLNIFDKADSAFISAYRLHHKDYNFEVRVDYVSCPSLDGRVLILVDPMIATGTSLVLSYKSLLEFGVPKEVHIISAIASDQGLDLIKKEIPGARIWVAAIDFELTAKSYIVPGLGDAGDLAFGNKE